MIVVDSFLPVLKPITEMGAKEQEVAPTVDRVYRVSLTALSLASQPPAAKDRKVPDLKPEASVAKEASEKASEPAEAPI